MEVACRYGRLSIGSDRNHTHDSDPLLFACTVPEARSVVELVSPQARARGSHFGNIFVLLEEIINGVFVGQRTKKGRHVGIQCKIDEDLMRFVLHTIVINLGSGVADTNTNTLTWLCRPPPSSPPRLSSPLALDAWRLSPSRAAAAVHGICSPIIFSQISLSLTAFRCSQAHLLTSLAATYERGPWSLLPASSLSVLPVSRVPSPNEVVYYPFSRMAPP